MSRETAIRVGNVLTQRIRDGSLGRVPPAASVAAGPSVSLMRQIVQALCRPRRLFGRAIRGVCSAFWAMDRDQRGAIGAEAFQHAMHRLGVGASVEQLTLLHPAINHTRDSDLTFEEWTTACVNGALLAPLETPRDEEEGRAIIEEWGTPPQE